MLRYIKHNMTEIDGIDIYPIISLLIFVIFFVVMFTYVARMKKSRVEELSALPFEEDNNVEPKHPLEK
ncbi:MAG: CcoQ/FixQ family Cbb3-type cytochrome c oxidase assembly chaperone [Flavobacteriales bacterium]|nr:CcoQ/FixQ family Cbb3-type cytochrome c oxidase assembly chaperone [Flavobacteriales bacterium]PIE87259.1 MAG: CcoQ/FixQ family Cbb3-type cytochrome c oxidase assembly chaperone [Bacteroidota bacterium]